MNFRWLEEITLAPDGSMVAYSVREPDAAANGYRVQLYLRKFDDLAAQCLSGGDCRVSALAWSRDSGQLAWCQRDGKGCSLRIWRNTEAVNCVIPLGDEPLAELDWSPDGIHLAGARWTPMLHPRDRRGLCRACPRPHQGGASAALQARRHRLGTRPLSRRLSCWTLRRASWRR